MLNSYDLKKYIIKEEKIEYILAKMNCHHIKSNEKDFRCGIPNHNNKTSISVKKDTLSVRMFQSDINVVRGDIFTLCMNLKNISFSESNKYIHKILNLKYEFKFNKKVENKKDPLEIFKKVKRHNQYDKKEINIYDDTILTNYIPYPHITWIREGIMPKTCEKFKIGYNAERKRIVIPERYWCGSESDYIGVMSRTVIKEWEMLDIPKYLPLKAFPKTMNIYGLQENYESIQKTGYVVAFEAQKSVLKRHSLLDETGVSLGSHDISNEQVRILISLNVEIVIAMDEGIDLQHIRSICEKFYKIRKVSYIYDKYSLLKAKESPADAKNKIYNYLFKHRIQYNELEHQKYLKNIK